MAMLLSGRTSRTGSKKLVCECENSSADYQLEIGALAPEQYEDQQDSILQQMDRFNPQKQACV